MKSLWWFFPNELSNNIIIIMIIIIIIIIPNFYIILTVKNYQPSAGFSSSSQQIDVKYHPSSLAATFCQHVDSLGRCWLSRPGLRLQISKYPNSSQCCFGAGAPSQGSNSGQLRARQWFWLCSQWLWIKKWINK